VNVENATDFAVEVDLTTLDAGSKQGAFASFKNRSGHSNTVGMQQPTDVDPITNVELKHPEIIRDTAEWTKWFLYVSRNKGCNHSALRLVVFFLGGREKQVRQKQKFPPSRAYADSGSIGMTSPVLLFFTIFPSSFRKADPIHPLDGVL
jgi:hypothetical protein